MLVSTVQTFCCIIIFTSTVLSSQLDDLKKEYVGHIMNCVKESPIPGSDIEQLKKKQIPESQNAKCFLACFYKKARMMDDQGMLSAEYLDDIMKHLSDDEEQMKKAKDFTEACKSVNEEPVSDGAQGCDRAALIFKCSIEKAPQFDLVS